MIVIMKSMLFPTNFCTGRLRLQIWKNLDSIGRTRPPCQFLISALAEAPAMIPDGSLEALKDSLEPTFAESSSENTEALAFFREEETLLRYLRSQNFDVSDD